MTESTQWCAGNMFSMVPLGLIVDSAKRRTLRYTGGRHYHSLLMGMEFPDNRREADDSYRALERR